MAQIVLAINRTYGSINVHEETYYNLWIKYFRIILIILFYCFQFERMNLGIRQMVSLAQEQVGKRQPQTE